MDFKKIKPSKKVMYFSGAIILGIIVLLTSSQIQSSISEKELAAKLIAETEAAKIATEAIKQVPIPTPAPTSTPVITKPVVINFQQYNYQFAETPVVNILTSMIGNGNFAIYLPSTGYINVSKGTSFGVAYAIKNPNPSGENKFVSTWTADDSVIKNCGISKSMAESYIKMGISTFGKITWNEWVDAATVYLEFPSTMKSCNLRYNFKVTKDGIDYASKQLIFNIL